MFHTSNTTKSRRLSYAVFVSALLALSSMLSIAKADEKDVHELEIGYMPILPVSQLFVGLENGWLEEGTGIKTKLVSF